MMVSMNAKEPSRETSGASELSRESGRVVVVDSNDREARRATRFLLDAGYEVHRFRSEEGAYNLIDELELDHLIVEARSPRIDGFRLMHVARLRNPELCAVHIVAPGEQEVGTRAMNQGAHDFQPRPLNLEKLLAVMRRANEHRRLVAQLHELEARLDRKYGLENIVGHSAAAVSMVARVRRLAASETPVLLWGEPGTGKAMLARVLHQQSSRRDGALVAIGCRGVSSAEIEVELFGGSSAPGSLHSASGGGSPRDSAVAPETIGTDALRIGTSGSAAASSPEAPGGSAPAAGDFVPSRLERARGGSLYMEDIDALSLPIQRRLIDVLDGTAEVREGSAMRGGSSGRGEPYDVRLLASTHRDLREAVDAGVFLEDLYVRFSAGVLEVPPLRHRRADVPLMVEHFLRELTEELDRPVPGVSPEAMSRFARYGWPGNVRELKSVLRGIVVAAGSTLAEAAGGGAAIGVVDLPPELQDLPVEGRGVFIAPTADWREAQRALIEAHLQATGFDREATARRLGLSRRTLYRRIAEFGIQVPRAWKS